MSRIFIAGYGAVSPAGWGVAPLREALNQGQPLQTRALPCPRPDHPAQVRTVPSPSPRPGFLAHARLRRTSPIAQYAVAAALEALGQDYTGSSNGSRRLGIVLCVMAGCVNYSRRFYDETLKDPATASPLVFPETVFNAPASHLAAVLAATQMNYTLVGDPGTFLQGLALAADWLSEDHVDGCLVIGAEEVDWLVTQALRLFDPQAIPSEGAGALYLRRQPGPSPALELRSVTDPQTFFRGRDRAQAARRVSKQLVSREPDWLLCDGVAGVPRLDRDEQAAWADWPGPRLSPKRVCGEGFTAAAAWQCIAALDALRQREDISAATVSVVGCNQQAIAAEFTKT
jgi:3-oxoacyl-[acyl-carrier-protein] synthase II